jgi:hypothetical protein
MPPYAARYAAGGTPQLFYGLHLFNSCYSPEHGRALCGVYLKHHAILDAPELGRDALA